MGKLSGRHPATLLSPGVKEDVIEPTDVSRCLDTAASDDGCSKTLEGDVVYRVVTSLPVDVDRRRRRTGRRRQLEATQ